MKLPKDIEELKLFFKVFSEKITEPCYKKPKIWAYALGTAATAVLCSGVVAASLYFGMCLPAKRELAQKTTEASFLYSSLSNVKQNLEQTANDIANTDFGKKMKELTERNQILEQELNAYKADHPENLTEEKYKASEAKADSLQQRLEAATAKLNEQLKIFDAYQKDHPSELTKVVHEALRATSTDGQKQLSDVLANLETVRAEFELYRKTHPADISKEALEALQKDRESLINLSKSYSELTQNLRTLEQAVSEGKKAFEVYKKDHPEEITLDVHTSVLRQLTEIKKKLEETTGLEQEASRKLTEAVDAIKKYKETHPEEITQEAYASLDSKLAVALQAADKAKTVLGDYIKTHPEDITQEAYSALEKQLADVKKELGTVNAAFDRYKKKTAEENTALSNEKKTLEEAVTLLRSTASGLTDQLDKAKKDLEAYMQTHPEEITKEKYDALQERLSSVEKALAASQESAKQMNVQLGSLQEQYKTVSERNAGLEKALSDIAGKKFEDIMIYKDSKTNELYFYFDITYDPELPPESVLENAGDWAGPKRVGRYVTRLLAEKFDAKSSLLKDYSGQFKDDFDKLWVRLSDSGGNVLNYTLVIEKEGKKTETQIYESHILQFIKNCISKK